MEIIPAVDILDGRCVRLVKGDFNSEMVYSDNPVEVASRWAELGAKRIHIVDLDGARTGSAQNWPLIREIAALDVDIQVGGGIRAEKHAAEVLKMGADRVILGTSALKKPQLIFRLVQSYPDAVIVGADCRSGRIATDGWSCQSDKLVDEFLVQMRDGGISRVIITDIDKDGTLDGPNVEMYSRLASYGVRIIASGGVGSEDDIDSLRALAERNPLLEGVIIGRALYDGRIDPTMVFDEE